VDIEFARYEAQVLHLVGTACAFEGNLLVEVADELGTKQHATAQASAGGPERGDWEMTIPTPVPPLEVRVADEDPTNGGLSPMSTVLLRVHSNGSISGGAPS
jgi:hypothetical protein